MQERIDTQVWELGEQGSTGNNARKALGNACVREAAALLTDGKLISFPTETVYGLGADARNTDAVARIFEAKGRPSDNPLIVHIANRSELDSFVLEVSEADEKLMAAFWPGPLTLVLPVSPGVLSPKVTAGLDTVAVRMPDHPVALELIQASGCPLAAPSANRSGRPSPTLASHVWEDLNGRIDGIVDGGPAGVGVESTVVRTNAFGGATVLRPGGVSVDELSRVLDAPVSQVSADHGADLDPEAVMAEAESMQSSPTEAGSHNAELYGELRDDVTQGGATEEAPRSPGMKYTHYAPSGQLEVVIGSDDQVEKEIRERLAAARVRGEKTGVLVFDEHLAHYEKGPDVALSLGSKHDLREAAARLYAALRQFDELGTTYMLAEGCSEEGIGLAIMNRMSKAAGGRIHRV